MSGTRSDDGDNNDNPNPRQDLSPPPRQMNIEQMIPMQIQFMQMMVQAMMAFQQAQAQQMQDPPRYR